MTDTRSVFLNADSC